MSKRGRQKVHMTPYSGRHLLAQLSVAEVEVRIEVVKQAAHRHKHRFGLHQLHVVDNTLELRVVQSPLFDLRDIALIGRHGRIHVQLLSTAAFACDVERIQLSFVRARVLRARHVTKQANTSLRTSVTRLCVATMFQIG